MKTLFKAVLAIIVVVALIAAALYLTQPGLFNVKPRGTATSETTQSPKTTSTPTATTLTPTPTSGSVITISYHSVDLDCGRQCADITITNQGYTSFSTNPEKFYVTENGVNYKYSLAYTPTLGNWENITIANGASYSGTLVFDSPKTTNPITIGYNDSAYHIVYVQG